MNKASPDDDVQRNVTLTNKGTILINDLNAALSRAPVVIGGNINNSGTVVINNCSSCAGQTLEVTGDWIGNGGTVSLGTVLGGDNSLTDQLIIGGNATGQTYVSVMNEGGSGAQTLEGIKIIETGSSTAGAFAQSGRIVAGSYDYTLGQGTGLNSTNWYLTSKQNNGTNTFRPEMGSYSANLAAASTLFNTQLSDRQGRNFFAGEQNPGHFWGRIVGGHSKANMSDGQSSLTANRVVFQVGGDIKEGTRNGSDAWNVGLMAGYGSQYSKTRNDSSGYKSKGDIHGYSMGGYGTWHEDAQEK